MRRPGLWTKKYLLPGSSLVIRCSVILFPAPKPTSAVTPVKPVRTRAFERLWNETPKVVYKQYNTCSLEAYKPYWTLKESIAAEQRAAEAAIIEPKETTKNIHTTEIISNEGEDHGITLLSGVLPHNPGQTSGHVTRRRIARSEVITTIAESDEPDIVAGLEESLANDPVLVADRAESHINARACSESPVVHRRGRHSMLRKHVVLFKGKKPMSVQYQRF
ncbi:hypothetical protein EK21DRAFT_112440 [Setomelanomma holmii]|uniref:Uncharacterized protein n=1 Tax=Setomelanomma holmii TaxID=210430 RepID=A0A9P4HAB8_9PLEO|nr:hypothetical protein EK21DRAFT_112440 [Setomelanomma holmii]